MFVKNSALHLRIYGKKYPPKMLMLLNYLHFNLTYKRHVKTSTESSDNQTIVNVENYKLTLKKELSFM